MQNSCILSAQSEELAMSAWNALLRRTRVKCERQRENSRVQKQVSAAGEQGEEHHGCCVPIISGPAIPALECFIHYLETLVFSFILLVPPQG